MSVHHHHAGSPDSLEPGHLVSEGLSCGCRAPGARWLGRQSGFTALCLTWRRCRGYKSKLSLKLLECLSLLLRHFLLLLLLLLIVPHPGPLPASHGSQARQESPESVAQSHDCTDERSPPRLFSATTKRMMGYFPQRQLSMISLKNAGAGT